MGFLIVDFFYRLRILQCLCSCGQNSFASMINHMEPTFAKVRKNPLCRCANDNENFKAIIRYQGASSRSTSQNTKLKLKIKTENFVYTLSYVKTSFSAFSNKVFIFSPNIFFLCAGRICSKNNQTNDPFGSECKNY